MSKVSLSQFVTKIGRKTRISFGDVQRLQRDVLADGISSREDAELLIELDRTMAKADAAWERWLVATLVDFVVWAERPTGTVDEDTARWLAAALAGGTLRHAETSRLMVREIVQEAQAFENDSLAVLAMNLPKAKPGRADMDVRAISLPA